MNIKPLLSSIMLSATVIAIAGCTTNSANTNSVNENTNTVVANSNENTNADQGSALDTSDWLTYTNEEYGFSLKYPGDWTADIINEGDEGGMGTSLGDIILYSNACEVTGTKLKTGSVDSIKKDLLSRGSTSFQEINVNGIKGVKYINVVNEDGDEGTIYSYVVNENEFSFAGRNRTQNDVCQTVVDSIIMSISLNS